MPRICIVFNNIDDTSSIGKLSAWAVRTALSANWSVTVVARDLAPDLRAYVDWLPMYVPPRIHLIQWLSARRSVKRAIGGRKFDVVHVSQPQLASMATTLHLHFLLQAARDRGSLPKMGESWRCTLRAAQIAAVVNLETMALNSLKEHTRVACVSEYLAREFRKYHPSHANVCVVDSPAPDIAPYNVENRRAARMSFGVPPDVFVIGFLGGDDPRKGGRELLEAARTLPNVRVLVGGAGGNQLVRTCSDPSTAVSAGYVSDTSHFYSACDAFAAPSRFDPGPLTILEAAAQGVPSIGSQNTGAIEHLVRKGAGLVWDSASSLSTIVDLIREKPAEFAAAARAAAAELSEERQSAALLRAWDASSQAGDTS